MRHPHGNQEAEALRQRYLGLGLSEHAADAGVQLARDLAIAYHTDLDAAGKVVGPMLVTATRDIARIGDWIDEVQRLRPWWHRAWWRVVDAVGWIPVAAYIIGALVVSFLAVLVYAFAVLVDAVAARIRGRPPAGL